MGPASPSRLSVILAALGVCPRAAAASEVRITSTPSLRSLANATDAFTRSSQSARQRCLAWHPKLHDPRRLQLAWEPWQPMRARTRDGSIQSPAGLGSSPINNAATSHICELSVLIKQAWLSGRRKLQLCEVARAELQAFDAVGDPSIF
jgi:hypothetical protein